MDKCGNPRRRATIAARVLLPVQAGPAKTISTLYSYRTIPIKSNCGHRVYKIVANVCPARYV